ncbi:MAG: ABC transporter ATP-binding protein [Actinomycetota bacterium]
MTAAKPGAAGGAPGGEDARPQDGSWTPGRPLPTASGRRLRSRVRRLLGRRRANTALVIGLAVVVAGMGAVIPALVGAAVDVAVERGSRGDLALIVVGIAAASIVGPTARSIGHYAAARLGESILDELRTEVYESTVALPAPVVETVGTGELVARATGDVETLADATRYALPTVFIMSLYSAGLLVGLTITDLRLAGVALVAAGLIGGGGVWWYLSVAPGRYDTERMAEADWSAALHEVYQGRRSLWAFGAEGVGRRRIVDRGEATVRAHLSTTAARNRLRPSLRLAQAAALCGVIAVGARFLDQGSLSVGTLSAAVLYLVNLLDPISSLLEQLDETQRARSALARIVGLTDLSAALRTTTTAAPNPASDADLAQPAPGRTSDDDAAAHDDQSDAPDLAQPALGRTSDDPAPAHADQSDHAATSEGSRLGGVTDRSPTNGAHDAAGVGTGVRLDRVDFGYAEGTPVLSDIDLAVPRGRHVLVVGPSGAGKSTLVGLMAGIHQPWRGTVSVGETPLVDIPPDEIRSRIAVIVQETHVFSRSVAENVSIGRPTASPAEVRRALEAAGAAHWVDELDDGVDTAVSANHPAITPARAQQLSLARIVCLDPAVVILDEATADLDPVTAAGVERRLEQVLAGRTVITVAHRLDRAPDADEILVLAEGRVVAQGPHDELAEEPGPYAELWRNWERSRAPGP